MEAVYQKHLQVELGMTPLDYQISGLLQKDRRRAELLKPQVVHQRGQYSVEMAGGKVQSVLIPRSVVRGKVRMRHRTDYLYWMH